MDTRILAEMLGMVREKRPLVHHITNYVTVNDCANSTLCIGAAPVMAHAGEEVEEIVAVSGALVLNIGTLSPDLVEGMLVAGKAANTYHVPVILDPVGAGATRLRTQSAQKIISEVEISVLKGNAGEIGVLSGLGGDVRGVDSAGLKEDPFTVARTCALQTGAVVVMSGPADLITDGKEVLSVRNGDPMMGRLSGTGCMAASLCGAFAAVTTDTLRASVAAMASFGRAGEIAGRDARGPYSFRTALLDALYHLTPDDLADNARIEQR